MDGMHEEIIEGELADSKMTVSSERPLVVRALRRSSVRRKIAEYLFDISPSASYTSEIAHHVKTTPTNVLGALRGMESRYRVDESLLSLNIVEMKKSSKDIKLYGITTFGKEILESLREDI